MSRLGPGHSSYTFNLSTCSFKLRNHYAKFDAFTHACMKVIGKYTFLFQFDVREDEEQDVKLGQTLDLLLAAGYFRARIKGLSPFDKVKLFSRF